MIIEYESQNSGKHLIVDKIHISKNEKGFFTCKLIQIIMDEKQITSKDVVHSSGKGFSKPEAFLSALDHLGLKEKQKDA
jgi:hypothetical protein